MSDDTRVQPLLEWNRLARENAENAIVSSMFATAACAIEPVDKFSTWLLVGAAAVAAFLITNSAQLIPILGKQGFLVCGLLLCVSCLLGILAKIAALRSGIICKINSAILETFKIHLAEHEREEQRIKENAEFWGIDINTGIRLERIISEFSRPLPLWAKFTINRKMKKNKAHNDPQAAYFPLISTITWLGYFVSIQSLAILAFLVSGFIYATTGSVST